MITNTSILSIFSVIRAALVANATLAVKFGTDNILQFEPKHKGGSFVGFPYIWVNLPENDATKLVFDTSAVMQEMDVSMFLRMDWEARDNVLNYCNAILKAIADYESTFDASGYYDVMIELVDVNPNQVIQQKQVVESEFLLTVRGANER